MRLFLIAVLVALAGMPAGAQTLSPLTGTTAGAPSTGTTAGTPPVGTPGASPARTRRTLQQRFEAANTTHDGKLTLEQAKAARMRRLVGEFDAIDAKKNGYITMDDIRAYNRARRAARKPAAQ